MSEVRGAKPPRHDLAWIACTILAAMVLAATLELVPMVAAALVAAAAMVATGCIGPNEARRSIEWETLLLIAASFGLARAIEKTGLDELIAQSTIGAAGRPTSPRPRSDIHSYNAFHRNNEQQRCGCTYLSNRLANSNRSWAQPQCRLSWQLR